MATSVSIEKLETGEMGQTGSRRAAAAHKNVLTKMRNTAAVPPIRQFDVLVKLLLKYQYLDLMHFFNLGAAS